MEEVRKFLLSCYMQQDVHCSAALLSSQHYEEKYNNAYKVGVCTISKPFFAESLSEG